MNPRWRHVDILIENQTSDVTFDKKQQTYYNYGV